MLLTAACATSSVPEGGSTYDSVRDRLADVPTRLYIGPEGSSGTITASRWTHDGWIDGTAPVTISDGELLAKTDAAGQLEVTTFEVGVDPIDIPESVFGKPAQLQNVRVVLHDKPAPAAVQWTSDDDATAAVTLDLDLKWAIAIDGNLTPLGTQHLPPITIDVGLTGGGDHVDGSVGLHASGDLWSWAGVIKLTDLELGLAAATLD